MSSFTLHFSRNQAPLTKGAFALALQRLTHRALDGQHSWESPSIALGHLHLHITPEGVGEEQPLVEPSGRYALVFDGRLDNRGELATALGISPSELRFTSDAALCLHSHLKWGEAAPTHLLGEFAWAVVDLLENQVFCARDPLGDRSLYYYLDPRLLVIASEPYAVLGCPGISNELDEVTLAHYFAVQVPADGRTYFKAVRELPAAHAMRVSAREVKTWRYWTPDPGHIRSPLA